GYFNRMEEASNFPALTPVVEALIKHRDGKLDQHALEAKIEEWSRYDVRNDFMDFLYQPAQAFNHSILLASGNGRGSVSAFANYSHGRGNLIGKKSNRMVLRSRANYSIFKNLDMGITLQYNDGMERQENRPGYGMITQSGRELYPYARLADDQGTPLRLARDYRLSFIDTAGNGQLLDWNYWPLLDKADHQV